MAMTKVRADQRLAELGLAESRERAKRLIMAGRVGLARGGKVEPVAKPGTQVAPDAVLTVSEPERFVGRGGWKLLTALESFRLDVSGFVCLDAGAATGGFTDCLLQAGAARVYAADVGKGLLHERLRADPRVVCLEGVNLRLAPDELLPEPVDLVAMDVSFISLTLAMPPCLRWLKSGGLVVALVKPQFELGPGRTRKGVVRGLADQQEAVDKVVAFARDQCGLAPGGVAPSAVKGPKGNQEYLALFGKP